MTKTKINTKWGEILGTNWIETTVQTQISIYWIQVNIFQQYETYTKEQNQNERITNKWRRRRLVVSVFFFIRLRYKP